MDIPPYHVCQALTSENESLNVKYNKLKRKYKDLHKQMLELQEQLTRLQIEREYHRLGHNVHPVKKAVVKSTEEDPTKETEKLLILHTKLLKQFEKETKQNNNQTKKLNKTESENQKLKDDIFRANQQIDYLKRQLTQRENQLLLTSSKVQASSTPKQDHIKQISSMTKEKNKLLAENRKLRDELKGLDKGFFEEIEDMKYALQQSAKLNTEYEKAIQRLCKQYGVQYETAFKSPSTQQIDTTNHISKSRRGRTSRKKSGNSDR